MTDYRLSPEITTQAQQKFSQLMVTRTLLESEKLSQGVSASRLYAYANGSLLYPQSDLDKALGQNLSLRRTYKSMVSKVASFYLPESLAASSDALPTREGEGCRISLKKSRAEPDQIYIIVELTKERDAHAEVLVVCGEDDLLAQIALPTPRNGVSQVIVEKNSEILTLLADPKSEAYVR
ncbi:MAG: hypothetical protein OQJ97_15030 [Rhodospirillales bacterium]|nr:hypothetical protein [Rhodospirillales bacterium]